MIRIAFKFVNSGHFIEFVLQCLSVPLSEKSMPKVKVELVKYDTLKTKKRKKENILVEEKTEQSVIKQLERIHKGDKVEQILEIVWGNRVATKDDMGRVVTGTVKFYSEDKGFGFIKPDIEMKDVFFHATSLNGVKLHDGDPVEFVVSEGPKGPVASKIQLIEDE